MKMPELPPLPERHAVLPDIVLPHIHGMGPNTTVLRQVDAFIADQLRSFALQYAESVREACDFWDLMAQEMVTVTPNYIRDASGRYRGWMAVRRGGGIWLGETPLEAMQKCAAAIRRKED